MVSLFKPPATVNHLHTAFYSTKMNDVVAAVGLTHFATRPRNLSALSSLLIVSGVDRSPHF